MSGKRIQNKDARIDRSVLISFTFDGKTYHGFQGDTLASALLANGVQQLAGSYKYGRPRGIMSAGSEEPNALMQLESGAYASPNIKATQAELYAGLNAARTSGKASGFDAKRLLGKLGKNMMPAGFYSKTFKWPQKFWPYYEQVIRGFAGFGTAPDKPDAEWYDHLHHHVDVLVIGGGLSGLLAARAAAKAGLSTLLVDEQPELGGWLLTERQAQFDGASAPAYLEKLLAELRALPNLTLLPRTTAYAKLDHNLVQAVELVQDHLPLQKRDSSKPRQRMHKIRAKQILLASGAIERPLVYGNNDLPGVFTLSAVQTYLNRYGVLVGSDVLLCGSHDGIYETARDLAAAGAAVTVADVRADAKVPENLGARVIVLRGYGIAEVKGTDCVNGAVLRCLQSGKSKEVSCDAVGSGGGQTPTVHLYCHDTSRPIWSDSAMNFVIPDTFAASKKGICGIGAVTGHFHWADCLKQTQTAVADALKALGKETAVSVPDTAAFAGNTPAMAVRLPDGKPEGHGAKAFVDYQNDVTAADIAIAVRENYHNIEHVKRYTAFGFGTDQGKLTSVNSFMLTAAALNVPVSSISTTTYRPAYTPVSFGVMAGSMEGNTFAPERTTAIHAAHIARGAPMEAVGQWWRPWYFPKNGEDIHASVKRECTAARESVAVMDASTLGKIQVDGRDAREFLNRIYSNAWLKLAPGKCRYGLMLDENGMVMDDGVTACINENQFHMTTTTGGAAKVLDWLERWHQTEWPELDVWFNSITDHWATVAVVGPKSRAVLQKLCTDIDFSADKFKFMDWFPGTVAGVKARVFRISFSGELAYEINVPAGYGAYLWDEVMQAGEEFNITPYGTETMHVLRAEKGFIIAGQDTDGSMSPFDLNMAWAVGMKKPFSFLGKRSLARSDTAKAGRKQLIGLYTADPALVLKEGAAICERNDAAVPAAGSGGTPVKALGHVTSSYDSAILGRSIAMAVVADGENRKGQTLYAYQDSQFIPVTVAESTVFVDPKGERQNV